MRLFDFIGRVLGKSIFEGVVVDLPLAEFVTAKLLGKRNNLDELPSLDPELAKSLDFLKHYDGDVRGPHHHPCTSRARILDPGS